MSALPIDELFVNVDKPLSRSPRLLRVSEQAAALSTLYSRGPAYCDIDGARWRFQWRYISGPMTGVEMSLRIGGAEAMLGLENLGPFGSATDVTRPEMPPALRAAFLNGLGAAAWQKLEAMTQAAIEVLDVQLDAVIEVTPESLGFELGQDPLGPATRGVIRLSDSDPQRNSQLQRVLSEASRREMANAPLPAHLPLTWAAVAGSTRLEAAEVRALEEHDIVLIDDARHTGKMLGCWLGVGPVRKRIGWAMLRNGGQLQMVQFGTAGETHMTSSDAPATKPEEAGFDEIPVSLRFELTQWNASLAEVANLAAGATIDLGHRIDEHSVSVWVEQRCIGKGQLVAIGERLGVRLSSIFAAESTVQRGT